MVVYSIEFFVDGGCRRNGQSGAIGAAAAIFQDSYGDSEHFIRELPDYPAPTNQRAELTAIIIALREALNISRSRIRVADPYFDVTIYSDSQYAINCMNVWVYEWSRNGWVKSNGAPLANQDLIQEAFNLGDLLKEEGNLRYVWISRAQNQAADKLCNEVMDDMEYRRKNYPYLR